jgi:predicted RNase H-like HicB family nuclease
MRYAVVIEKSMRNYGAYAPDVPGCVAMGRTWDEVVDHLRDALIAHLEVLRDEGLPIPPPTSREAPVYVEVPSPDASASAPGAPRRRDVPLPESYDWLTWLSKRDAAALLLASCRH